MQKTAPCFWFDTQSVEASEFYVSMFENSKIECIAYYPEGGQMPTGSVLSVRFTLCNQEFNAINGGPIFEITPAISLTIHCDSAQEVDTIWEELSEGGTVLMELGEYPFCEKFGWVRDKFGVSWQVGLFPNEQKIVPCFMFVGQQHGRAEEAVKYYCQVFENSKVESIELYHGSDIEPDGTVVQAKFEFSNQKFTAMDSAWEHKFTFTEGLSFYIYCNTQAEIDYFWEKLTDGGEESQCGWLKDKFGVSWQIVNEDFEKLISNENPKKAQRVMDELFKMKKIDMQKLLEAYNQE